MSDEKWLAKQGIKRLEGFGCEGSAGDIEQYIETLEERIAALEAALFNTVTELESWNLTEGDLESVVVIKAAKDALRAAGKME